MSNLFTIKATIPLIECDMTATELSQGSHVTFWKTDAGGFCLTYLQPGEVCVEHHYHLGRADGHPQSRRASTIYVENAAGQTTATLRSNLSPDEEQKLLHDEQRAALAA